MKSISEGVNMSEGAPKVTAEVEMRPRPTEALFELARQPIFPLCVLKFEKREKIENPVVTVGVSEEVYRRIRKIYGTDQIILHCTLPDMVMGLYTPTMQRAQDLLEEDRLVLRAKDWVKKAQPYLEKELGI